MTDAITKSQLHIICHAVGVEHPKSSRNYFYGRVDCSDLQALCAMGLMCRGCCEGDKAFFHVTPKGYDFLGYPESRRVYD